MVRVRLPRLQTTGACRLGRFPLALVAACVVTATPAAAQTLLSIEVRPPERIVEVGETRSLTAIGVFTGGLLRDITDQVEWSSSNPEVAVVTPTRGQVTGIAHGVTFISARAPGGVSSSDSGGDALISVPAELESVRIVPDAVELPAGLVRSLNAEGVYGDGATADVSNKVDWSSTNPTVVSVSNDPRRKGELTTRRPGVAVVMATDPVTGVSSTASNGDATVTVRPAIETIVISPAEEELSIGGSRRLSASAILADTSVYPLPRSRMLWASSDTRVATVSNEADTAGLVTALAAGSTTISAVHVESGIAARERATIVVLDRLVSLSVTPADRGLDLGQTSSMTATGRYANGVERDLTDEVIWASSSPAVVSVSNEPGNHGRVTGRRSGVAFVSASLSGVSSTNTGGDGRVRVTAELVSVRIEPAEVLLPIGFGADLDAEATFADQATDDITNDVEWESSNPAVVTVSNEAGSEGELVARAPGTAVIRAVDLETGISSAASGGDAVVTVAGSVLELFVTPTEEELTIDDIRRFNVRARLDNGELFTVSRRRVEWTSSDPDVIVVGNDGTDSGEVTAVGFGEALLSAIHLPTGHRAAAAEVVVRGGVVSLAVRPPDRTIELGETKSMTALGTFSNDVTGDITDEVFWTSSDESVVTVSNEPLSRGRATAVGPGVAFISAIHEETGISSTASGEDARVRVPAELVSIGIVPGEIRLAAGFTTTAEAEGTFEDESVDDLSSRVRWSTSNPSVAVVSNEPDEEGDVTAVRDGVAIISVVDDVTGISSADTGESLTVTVRGRVVGLSVTPRNESLPVGLTRRFNARALFENGDDASFVVTPRTIEWRSSDTAVATIGNGDDGGLAKAIAIGDATLSVAHAASGLSSADGDGEGDARLRVPGRLVGLEVTPGEQGLFIGTIHRLGAQGRLDDGSVFRLSGGITFRSSNPSVASVDNGSGRRGDTTGVAPGIATVSVTHAASRLSSSSSGKDAVVLVFEEPESLHVEASRTRLRTGNRTRVTAFGRATRPGGAGDSQFIDVEISNDVDWTSSAIDVVDVEDNQAVAFSLGRAVLSATDPVSGLSSTESDGDVTVQVIGALRQIKLKPRRIRARIGGPVREFRAIGRYSDGARLDITEDVDFFATDPDIADVLNERNRRGEVVPVSPGRTSVTATEPVTGVGTPHPGRAIVKKSR